MHLLPWLLSLRLLFFHFPSFSGGFLQFVVTKQETIHRGYSCFVPGSKHAFSVVELDIWSQESMGTDSFLKPVSKGLCSFLAHLPWLHFSGTMTKAWYVYAITFFFFFSSAWRLGVSIVTGVNKVQSVISRREFWLNWARLSQKIFLAVFPVCSNSKQEEEFEHNLLNIQKHRLHLNSRVPSQFDR